MTGIQRGVKDGRPTAAAVVLAVVAVLGALVLAGCSTSDAPKVVDGGSTATSAPSGSSGDPSGGTGGLDGGVSQDVFDGIGQALDDGLTRWDQDTVTVSVAGTPTPRDLEIVDETLAAFAPLSGLTFERVGVQRGSDLDISFVPTDTWPPLEEGDTVELGADGEPIDDLGLTTWESDADGAITEAQVYVDPAISQALRNSTISHELTHALGLGHVECTTSVVDDGAELDLDWAPTAYDDALIATWYDPDVELLTTESDLDEQVTVSPGGADCAPWELEGVEIDDGVLVCDVEFSQYQSCMVYDGAGPLPSLDAWVPTYWVDEESFYTYDPLLYEEIDVDEGRALCELEPTSGSDRRPCQITDGPGPVTDPTIWTDGEYVYDSP